MDYTSEIVNITKIKDGFFLGDEATASNLDVIIQFKITHMINAAGSQIINAWESIGIKYLTLNWSENSNQNLFDQKDEIANRIVNFIDDTSKNGEGILVHSLRGQNRACLVVIIYLVKKYRWTLSKALEFLTNKKFDVEIPKYFLNQLSFFESRLSKTGQGPKSASWTDVSNEGDPEEVLMRNTYINGLASKNEKSNESKPLNYNNRRIVWADNNNQNSKNLLCSTNLGKELMYQKDIKPVNSHKNLKPNKSILRSRSAEVKKSYGGKIAESINMTMGVTGTSNTRDILNVNSSISNNPSKLLTSVNFPDNKVSTSSSDLLKNYTNLGMFSNINTTHSEINHYQLSKGQPVETTSKGKENINKVNVTPNNNMSNNINTSNTGLNTMKPVSTNIQSMPGSNNPNPVNSLSSSINPNNSINNNPNNTRQNNFTMTSNNPQQRSYSVGNDPEKTKANSTSSTKGSETNIIIASKYKNVVHNSYNNIYIQSPQDLEKIYNNNTNYDSSIPSSQMKNDRQFSQNKKETANSQAYTPNIGSSYVNSNVMGNSFKTSENVKGYINNSSNNYIKDMNSLNSQNPNLSNQQQQSGKLTKSGENQRMLQNNFFSNNTVNNSNPTGSNLMDYNKLKVIDYNTQNSQSVGKTQIQGNFNSNNTNYQQMYNTQSKNSLTNSIVPNPLKQQGFSINNYQPELNKKNTVSSNNTGLLNRPSSQNMKQGPIKIQNEYDKKPSTPDTTISHNVKLISTSKPANSQQQYGTIKRSGSKPKNEANERPSTAPQKENEKGQTLNQQSSLKRLPSPNLKIGNTSLGSSQKNMQTNITMGSSINMGKYRSPSPSTVNKSSTITIGSLKSASNKAKWK